ncbi:exodeoxyribonuclease VII small subunit [Desulfolutivibrio sp.]|uniref:exodeoxyribonuclease VII small subunit n=1 Tax=Desulfolutivibrio sp. TaxID=2773296 RepID=UPI002F96361D
MSVRQESFEKTLERLEAVVARLESGDAPLDKGVTLFKEGMALAASCRKRLDDAKMEISLAMGGPQGGVTPFAVEPGVEDAPEGPGGDADVG